MGLSVGITQYKELCNPQSPQGITLLSQQPSGQTLLYKSKYIFLSDCATRQDNICCLMLKEIAKNVSLSAGKKGDHHSLKA